ncbi:ER membrane protein complex subunit 10-like [Anneissia japonica]|uniref:ER membrane protein complex subunit 10-like n=1 Tax=Anneissia japonica TaxID=1529436 RepID=UPI00142560C5|nr:ER membrane protein complex subunit 10-like [Anneissia japonica]
MEFSMRSFATFCLHFFVFLQCVNSKKPLIDDSIVGGLSLPIEHSFESGPDAVFHMRASIHFRSPLKMGPGTIIHTIPLTSAEQSKLKSLAKKGGFYRVRVPTQLTESFDVDDFSEAEDYVYTFTKACSLVESHLRDDITIHADQSGNVLSVILSPAQGTCHGLPVTSDALASFNSTVSLTITVPGPLPDTQAYIQKLEDEKQQKAKGAGADNRSFFAKYWMYIVPIVLFAMLSGGGEQGRA